jgi:hypothetical protein
MVSRSNKFNGAGRSKLERNTAFAAVVERVNAQEERGCARPTGSFTGRKPGAATEPHEFVSTLANMTLDAAPYLNSIPQN